MIMKKRGQGIVPVKNLFAKYKYTLKAPQKTVEMEFIRVTGELTSLHLKETQVSYTTYSRTISLKVPSVLKQEFALHKTLVLAELVKRLGQPNAPLNII